MRDSVPSASYSSVCNVLRQWNILLIPTYRVYRLYDSISIFIHALYRVGGGVLPSIYKIVYLSLYMHYTGLVVEYCPVYIQ